MDTGHAQHKLEEFNQRSDAELMWQLSAGVLRSFK